MRLTVLAAMCVLSSVALAADRPSQIPLIGDSLFPESVAYNPRTTIFYVSGNGDGSVQTVTNGEAKILQAAGTDGRTSALGIKVDDKHDKLWVISPDTVFIYSLSKNTLVKKIDLASVAKDIPAGQGGMNDVAIDAEGNGYVTESMHPILLKVEASKLEKDEPAMSVFRDLSKAIPYGKQNGFPYNLNGIVFSADGKSLLSVKTNEGTLWRINLNDNGISQVQLSEAVTKGDGLAFGQRSEILYIVRNFENKISSVDLSVGKDSVARQVKTVSPKGVKVPTGGAYVDARAEAHLVVVNSQFSMDPAAKPVLPFSLTSIPESELRK